MGIRVKTATEEIVIDLDGPNGNAFYLLGTAQQFSRDLGLDGDNIINEMKSGDYVNLITTFLKYFGDFVVVESTDEKLIEEVGNAV